jgi:hypothetical protein
MATLVDEPATALSAEIQPGLAASILDRIGVVWNWFFGTTVLILGLAVLAAIPMLQFLTFGYLLEVAGRVGRTGRLRDGFIGHRQAARVGSILLGAAIIIAPLKLVSSLWLSAELIDSGGDTAQAWRIALVVLSILAALHIAIACALGGRLRHFIFPFPNPFLLASRLAKGGYVAQLRDQVWNFAVSLRLPYYFWLGLRGFIGSFVWLAIPVTLLAVGRQFVAVGVLGWLLLVVVLLYVPFLQVQFAAKNRFRALFDIGSVRRQFRRAPLAFAGAFLITLSFALPLYLLKIEMIPREAAWLPSLVFIVFIFPARLLTGWSFGCAAHRATDRHWLFRWSGRLSMLAFSAVYCVVVYFAQYVAWSGIWSLYEQHAFLLPVPFFSM